MARRRHRLTVATPHPRRRAAAVRVSPPQDWDQQDRPTLAELHRRVCVWIQRHQRKLLALRQPLPGLKLVLDASVRRLLIERQV